MTAEEQDEQRRLRAVALQNAQAILAARQRAEGELAAERERLRITLASIGDAVISTDADGRVAFLNRVAEALTGWPQAEAAGRPLPEVFRIIHERTRQPVENPALRALKEGVVVGLANHTVLIARDGSERPIDDSAAPMRDEQGNPVGAVLVFRDVTERRRAEEARARLAAIVESSDDAIVSKTLDGVIRTWNAGAERIFGYTAGEAVGKPITLIIPPERYDEEGMILGRLRGGQRIDHYQTVRVAKDGRRLDISLSVSPMRDADGNIIGASKVARDITAQKRAEAALRASEERLAAELEAMNRLHALSTRLVAVTDLRPALDDVLGEAVRTTRADFGNIQLLNAETGALEIVSQRGFGTDFLEHFREVRVNEGSSCAQAMEAGERTVIEDVELDPTFEPHREIAARAGYRSVQSTPLKGRNGVVMGMLSTHYRAPHRPSDRDGRLLDLLARHAADVVERLRSEQVLRHSEARFRTLASHAPVGIFQTGPDGSCQFVNERWAEMAGLSFEEACGPGWAAALHPDDRDRVRRAWYDAAAAVRDFAGEYRFRTPGGKVTWVSGSAVALRSESGTVAGYIGTVADITARKEAEETVRSLLRVSERLNSTLEVEDLLDILVQEAISLVRADSGVSGLRTPEGLVCRRYFQRGSALPLEYCWPPMHGLPGWLLVHKVPYLTNDAPADAQVVQELCQRFGVRSALSTPILTAAGEVLGFFEIHNKQDGGFTPADRELLLAVAQAAAVALQNALAYRRIQQAEEALRGSERRFRQLADAMPQIVWTAGPDGQIDYLNRRWTEFSGVPDTVGNESWGPLLHPDEAPQAGERWAASVATGAPFEMELRLLDRRQQAYRWHLLRTVAVNDDAGRFARWYGTATDIHEQKRAEEASRFLAEASAALAAVVDHESTLQKVANLAVPRFADWSAVDVVENGRLRRLAVAHQDPEKVRFAHELMQEYPPDPDAQSGVLAVLRTGRPDVVAEITDDLLVRGAKDERHLRLIRSLGLRSYICLPLVVSGSILGALTFATAESGRRYTDADVALATDLAHRAAVAIENTRLYDALREQDRRKDEFLATLAHELRNPLAPIRNALQILKMPRVDAATAERSRDMMERQVHHLVRMVDDLLDVSRVMRGKIDLRRERVELATVVARAVETVQPLVDAQGHELTVRLPPESLPLDADPVRLAQVIGNLLTNAAKYTEPGGRIWLIGGSDGDTAVLRVRDNGMGITPLMLPRIFELFVQADHAAAAAQGGLGIGLTLVKNLVEMHNGTVEARSEGRGRGSEFVVRLPLAARETDEAPSANAGVQAPAPASSGLRLLVVDDNHDAADSLVMLLRLKGHEVRVAYSGMAVLEMTKTYTPDVVFLDIGMPRMDGYEVARRLRQTPGLEKTVLAALTGWGQQEDRRRTAEAGFDHHLVKPPEPAAVDGFLAGLKRGDRQ
jgi:PAS domain S-box-containing protein